MVHLIVIDFEVFKKDWMVVIADLLTHKMTHIINDKAALEKWWNENCKNIMVGYNIKGYDQYILKALLAGFNPYEVSHFIIQEGQAGYKFSSILNRFIVRFYDVMQPLDHGLKFAEGSMGSDIKESNIPFDIDRKLTSEELSDVLKYCKHDVEETIKVLSQRTEDLKAQFGLCKLAGQGLWNIGRTQTQLAAIILKARKQEYNDEFDIDVPDTLNIKKYIHIVNWYKDPSNMDYQKSLETDVAGVPHTFAFGGLHGAIEKYHYKGKMLMLDVESLYPSLMIRYNLHSRSIPDPKVYEQIKETRIKYKHENNPLQLPLKLVLNKTYGAMKDKYNSLYDPRQANRVCIYGQLLILDLVEHLEAFCGLIQTNTDGILIRYENRAKIDQICEEWQKRTGLKLEATEYEEVWQKDVNNYIIRNGEKLKTKGAYVKKLTTLDYGDYPIVNRAIIEALVHEIPVEETIENEKNLIHFQMVAKITGKYISIYHGNECLNLKCCRIFASSDKTAPGCFKRKAKTLRLEKISNSPEHTFILNDNVIDIKVDDRLDKEFYKKLANKRLKEFICI